MDKKCNKIFFAGITLIVLIFLCKPVLAVPFLQLDISDGVYVGGSEETVFATSSSFTLYAVIDGSNKSINDQTSYYISAALVSQKSQPSEIGSFDFASTTIQVTQDMTYGTPPIEAVVASQDLQSHDIFPTYFTEFSFTIDSTKKAVQYNVQDSPGGLIAADSGTLFYAPFEVDASGIPYPYSIHFDLYTKNTDGSIAAFAPFSHDAQTAPVPEPATMLLLGAGLIGLAGFSRKRFKKSA